MGIDENNSILPDLGFAELKTKQNISNAMDTLFSAGTRKKTKKKPIPNWKNSDKYYLQKKYGTGYQDIRMDKENCSGLKLSFENETIIVKEKDGNILYEQQMEEIKNNFLNKLKNQCYVEIERVGYRQMKIIKTTIYKNASFSKLIEKFMEGKVMLENRVGSDGHDHGTAFRGKKKIINELYETIEAL